MTDSESDEPGQAQAKAFLEFAAAIQRDARRQAQEDVLERLERVWKPRLDAVDDRLDRLEGKSPNTDDHIAWGFMKLDGLSSLQHACLQMVLTGKSLAEMSARLNRPIESIKSILHLIGKSMTGKGQSARYTQHQMRKDFEPAFNAISDQLYQRIAGIPKNWVTACDDVSDRVRHPFLYERRKLSPKSAPTPAIRRMGPPSPAEFIS